MAFYLTFLMTCLQSLSRWVRVSVAGVWGLQLELESGCRDCAASSERKRWREDSRGRWGWGGRGRTGRGESLKGPRRGRGSCSDVPPLVSPPLTPAFKPPVWAPLELSWKQGGKQDQAKWVGLRRGRREREHSRAAPRSLAVVISCGRNGVGAPQIQYPAPCRSGSLQRGRSFPSSPCQVPDSSPKFLPLVTSL